MPANPIVIGLVGAGFASTFHVENFRRVPGLDIRIKGVTSKSPERAAAFAQEHHLEETYDSVEALLADPEITLVDLCAPNYLHHPLTLQAAAAGKHIICEKPLTGFFDATDNTSKREIFETALKSADEMVEAVARHQVKFCYGENWVYAPSIQKANHTLAQSDNTILRIVAEECHSGTHSPYAKEWRYCGGGALYNKGCHPVGAALYLKYSEGRRKHGKPIKPKSVVAQVANLTRSESFVKEEEKWIQTGWVSTLR